MRRGRIKLAGAAICAIAGLASAHSVYAGTTWIVNQTVTIPPTPAVLTVTAGCNPDGRGNSVIWVTLNGTPVVVTVPGASFWCTVVPITVGGSPGTPVTVQVGLVQPVPPPCAVQEGGNCLAYYPINHGTDSLFVNVCVVGTAACVSRSVPI